MKKIAVIAGAGSGVGRAVALRMVNEGWSVAIIGRSRESLDETIRAAGANAGDLLAYPCDIGDQSALSEVAAHVEKTLGDPTALVNSAGTNIPKRHLDVLSTEDFDGLLKTNLSGAFYFVHSFLPAMRRAGGGTVVNVISDAGMIANAKAGAAYVASKFGLRGLTQAINVEQRQHNIRACGIFPGDINTPLLNRRPTPPTSEQRQKMLQPEDVAECVMLAINLPSRAVVEELLLKPPY